MANAQASLLIGREAEELVGRTDIDVLGAAGEAAEHADLELMDRGATEVVEEEPIVVDGEPRTFLRTKTPLRDGDGTVVGLVSVSSDISERKRAEEQLLRREAQLAEAQELARVGTWEWDVQNDSVTWSREFYEMLGMDPEEVKPTYRGFIDVIHPDDRAAAEGALERALEGGGSYAVAHRLIRADGSERMMICRGRVDRDLDGTPLRLIGASLDLTEYMGIAEELRMRHEQLLAAEALGGTGSFEWDVNADEVTWSKGLYRVFGMEPEDFDGTFSGYLERVHPADRGRQRRGLEQLLERGESASSEYRIVRLDGVERRIRSRVVVERDPDGRPRRLLGVCTDITDDGDA